MIHVTFSFPNLYERESFSMDLGVFPMVGDRVRVYGEVFKVYQLEWVIASSRKYIGGLVIHLQRVE